MSTPGPLVLVVEDEPQLRRFLRVSLGAHDHRVVEAETAREAAQLIASHNPEVVLLDLGLPDGDGIELTRQLRTWTGVPIVVLSARGREADKVEALDAGADDYLTKPFGVGELLARLRLALRHARRGGPAPGTVLELGELRLDTARRQVAVRGQEVKLTATEFRILAVLAAHPGRVLTHRVLLAEVWGPGHSEEAHHLRVHVAELRKKLEQDPARPRILLTELGVGYRLADPG